MRHSYTPILACVVLLSCSERGLPTVFDGPLTSAACALAGTNHNGQEQPGTWQRRGSPHVLTGAVRIEGTLIIEPGSVICGMPGSSLFANDLKALGVEELPILFTSDHADGWLGLRGSGVVSHAIVENTENAVWSENDGFDLEDVHILRSRGAAVVQAARLKRVVIDSACTSAQSCAAVYAIAFGAIELEDVSIRWSGGSGVGAGFRACGVTINGGLIQGSAGPGLDFITNQILRCGLAVIKPMRITGGASYPARVHADAARELLRHPEALALMNGNARDTLYVNGAIDFGAMSESMIISAGIPVKIGLECGSLVAFARRLGRVAIQPGASLTLVNCPYHGHVSAWGTPTAPITISGGPYGGRLVLAGTAPDTAFFSHVLFLRNMHVRTDSAPAIFNNVIADSSSLALTSAGSRIDGLLARGSGSAQPRMDPADSLPVVTLAPGTTMRRAHIEAAFRDGVLITDGSGLAIEMCTIKQSGRNGIRVLSGSPAIRACNLLSNDSAGVYGGGPGVTDASNNWWGDPAGPTGPSGDNAEGSVLTAPYLTAPAAFMCGPQCVSPSGAI